MHNYYYYYASYLKYSNIVPFAKVSNVQRATSTHVERPLIRSQRSCGNQCKVVVEHFTTGKFPTDETEFCRISNWWLWWWWWGEGGGGLTGSNLIFIFYASLSVREIVHCWSDYIATQKWILNAIPHPLNQIWVCWDKPRSYIYNLIIRSFNCKWTWNLPYTSCAYLEGFNCRAILFNTPFETRSANSTHPQTKALLPWKKR